MIKAHVIKIHWWIIKITFVKWMHITCLIDHFLEAALFWDVSSSFWSTDGVVFVWQMRRDYKIKFSDKLKANLWINLDLAKVHRLKELTFPYVVSHLHFLNLNNILALPKLLPSLKLHLIWHDLHLPCFLPARFTLMRASLQN